MTIGDLKLQDYLQHMLEATRLARSYVAGMDKSTFLSDRRTQQAVVLNLITLGEIATRLMSEHPEFASENPGIPWHQMRGMRNRMAHGYFDIKP
jgi:uncharacterized protein with HEPN domain